MGKSKTRIQQRFYQVHGGRQSGIEVAPEASMHTQMVLVSVRAKRWAKTGLRALTGPQNQPWSSIRLHTAAVARKFYLISLALERAKQRACEAIWLPPASPPSIPVASRQISGSLCVGRSIYDGRERTEMAVGGPLFLIFDSKP